ncbi:MAG: DegV family protein [Anaerolineales bacterium]
MKRRIVIDSTCDLPAGLVEEYSIEVLPVYINIGDKGYLDGVDISRQEFYQNLPSYPHHPTTAAPSPDTFRALYQQLAREGAEEILSLHIASSLSATVEMARSGAEDFAEAKVTVFDTGQLSTGAGFMAESAATAFAQGKGIDQVVEELKELGQRAFVVAGLETMEFLRRSGRVSSLVAGLGGFLQIKPLLTMHGGVADSQRVRTYTKALDRVAELIGKTEPIERLALVHTNAPEQAQALRERILPWLPEREIPVLNITPVIGVHIGPGAAGAAWVSRDVPSDEVRKLFAG